MTGYSKSSMECNKPEAIRAKEIAEKKMRSCDFVGARRLGQKAQHLFPAVENISQLLAVCDVHCAAQNNVNASELDWYAILQVERTADDAVIRKQYRKLALLLHPDKNKLAGAEAAFKLVGQANTVLSDQGKRSMYDLKVKASVRNAAPKAPPHQVNRNANASKQFVGPDVAKSQFTGSNIHKQASTHINGKETFWTCCPFCNTWYQYYRDIVNRHMRCRNCSKFFTAYDLGAQDVPQASGWSQKQVPTQSVFGCKTAGSESVLKRECPADAVSSCNGKGQNESVAQGGFSGKTAGLESVKTTTSVASGPNSAVRNGENVKFNDEREGFGVPKPDVETHGNSGPSKHLGRRKRTMAVESSESCNTASTDSSEEDSVAPANHSELDSKINGVHPRRSSRRKRHVSYNESDDDDSFVNPSKVSKVVESPSASGPEIEDGVLHDGLYKSNTSFGFPAGADVYKDDVKENRGVPFVQNIGSPNFNINKVEPEAQNDSEEEFEESGEYQCPDPEFNDFDKDKADNCMAVDQIWACYDNLDGMPRYYARVRKLFSGEFKLRITWLEPDPNEGDEIEWVSEKLPVACGRFKHGGSDTLDKMATLSHQMKFGKGTSRCTFMIYPRGGETWALYKNWDMNWKSDPESHRKYEYDIVVVATDFCERVGVIVSFMEKVKGFVSLFKESTLEGVASFRIPPEERFRFSHRIPSFRLTGTEREGIPKGAIELDPSSLPSNLTVVDHANNVKMESKGKDSKLNDELSEFPKNDVKARMHHGDINTPEKGLGMQEENDLEGKNIKPRRSPRSLNDDNKPTMMDSR